MLLPALRCLSQHGRYEHAVSFAAGVRAGGWRGAGERAIKAAGCPAPQTRFKMSIIFTEMRITLINAVAMPESARL